MPTIPNTLQSLNTAVLSATLDSLALMQQAMKPFMRPLDDTLQLIGRARTGVYMPVYRTTSQR
jgi:4-hydroxy-4-methyl-2-oxoglutarate aldolase